MKVLHIPRFELGDWVVYAAAGNAGASHYMVVDFVPRAPVMVLARIDPTSGKPYEILATVAQWRLA